MIGALLRPKTFLDRDLESWSLEAWAWLMRHLGGMERLADTALAMPTREFFPPTEATGHARAQHVFDCVRAAMGMAEWECELKPFERRPHAKVGEFWVVPGSETPLGTFEYSEDGYPIIRYGSDLIDQPWPLVVTLAHELSHYLVASVQDEPWPGGAKAYELVTELTVAYAGFGMFAANEGLGFRAHGDTFSQGWQTTGAGYLSEPTWAFALALFLHLKGEPLDATAKWLKLDVFKLTRKAMAYLDKRPELTAQLRAIP